MKKLIALLFLIGLFVAYFNITNYSLFDKLHVIANLEFTNPLEESFQLASSFKDLTNPFSAFGDININSLSSFFSAFGKFFKGVGDFFYNIGIVLYIPIQILVLICKDFILILKSIFIIFGL